MRSHSIPVARFFPNLITFLGLCTGLTSIKFSLAGRWELAVAAIVVAAIVDGLDGRIARMLDSSSTFGAELDSLADIVSFGVAPAFMLYFWELQNIKVFGWGVTMMFVVCMAVRLARFNVYTASNEAKKEQLSFFYGVPAPAGGILFILPMIFIFGFEQYDFLTSVATNHYFLIGYLSVISMLTVSHIPTFSPKNIVIPQYLESALTFIVAVIAVAFILKPWIAIPLLSLFYIFSMPISCFMYSKQKSKAK